ncbi:Hypp3845 [Branchiostoma lanceolatum]|uniref:Hypp3845 protein n=1 Tax=Branchiostoma lanceolatum TaxID=7740 RepID=A0A8K0EW29_BRALA|nr:Hypp3845 [Branchiostoma lanceolatum]
MSARGRSVHVRGLPELSGLQDKVSGYFQSGSLSAGGAVLLVKLLGPGQAVVTFADETVAQNVLAQPQHTLCGTRIKVTACPPHLEVPEESLEDAEETEKAATEKSDEDEEFEDPVLSEEEMKLGQAEVEAVDTKSQGSVKDLMKRFQSPDPVPSLARVKAAESRPSTDSEYATPPESPTPKCLPGLVSLGTRVDEDKPVLVDSLLLQKSSPPHQQPNADSSDSTAPSQPVLQLMAESCPFESLTEPGQPEDDCPKATGSPAPPKIPPKPPKPTVPPKPAPKPTSSPSAPMETTSPQHSTLIGAPMGDQEQLPHPKPTPICSIPMETTVTAVSSQHPNMCSEPGDQPQHSSSEASTTSSVVPAETSSAPSQYPKMPSGEQSHSSPATTSSVMSGATSAFHQQPNRSNHHTFSDSSDSIGFPSKSKLVRCTERRPSTTAKSNHHIFSTRDSITFFSTTECA